MAVELTHTTERKVPYLSLILCFGLCCLFVEAGRGWDLECIGFANIFPDCLCHLACLRCWGGEGYSTKYLASPPLKFPMSSFPSIFPDSLQLCSYFALVRRAVCQEQFKGVSQPAAPPGYCLGRTDWLYQDSSTPSSPTQ